MGKQLSICCVGDLILDEPAPLPLTSMIAEKF